MSTPTVKNVSNREEQDEFLEVGTRIKNQELLNLDSSKNQEFLKVQEFPQSRIKNFLPSSAPTPASAGLSWPYCQLNPVRPDPTPSGIVLSRLRMTLTSKAKLLVSMVRLYKCLKTLTLLVIGVI